MEPARAVHPATREPDPSAASGVRAASVPAGRQRDPVPALDGGNGSRAAPS